MPARRIGLGRGEPLAFFRNHVYDHAALVFLRHGQGVLERGEVVSVHRPDVAQAELLEERVAEPDGFDHLLEPVVRPAEKGQSQAVPHRLRRRLHAVVAHVRDETPEEFRHRAAAGRYRHRVVIHHEDELLRDGGAVVQGLQGLAVRKRGVPDHRDDMFVAAARVARRRHAERGRERVAGVSRHEGVRRALVRVHERGLSAVLPQRGEGRTSFREQLPGVGLVSDVPKDAVMLGVEHVHERTRKLHGAERGREVPSVLRHDLDDFFAQGVWCGPLAHAWPPLRRSRAAYEARAASKSSREKSGHSTSVK